MGRVVLTITIDTDSGSVVVGPETRGPAQSWTEPLDEAPWPSETPASAPTMPVAAMQASGLCPRHHVPWKVVPAGISKTKVAADGSPVHYAAFTACPEKGCEERPRR